MQTRSLFRKLFAQVLGLLLLLSSGSLPAMAQDDSSNPGPSPTPGNSQPQAPAPSKIQQLSPEKMKKRRLARLERIVQLTPDQQNKVTPMISDFVDQLVAVRSDSSLQPEEKQAKQKELRKKFTHEIKTVLTPQQRQALKNASKNEQHQGKGPTQNGNAEENQFEEGTNQPGSGI